MPGTKIKNNFDSEKDCFSLNKIYNRTIQNLTLDEKNHFIDAISTVFIWRCLLKKNHPDAPNKFEAALKVYEALCQKYDIDPQI